VLEVLFRAQLRNAVSGELPLQGSAKTLPILEAGATPVRIPIGWIGKVEQRQRAGQGAESLNLNF